MTMREIYDKIIDMYGNRGCYICEVATNLGVSRRLARYLTQAAGYHRGRAVAVVPYSQFSTDANVIAIHNYIK